MSSHVRITFHEIKEVPTAQMISLFGQIDESNLHDLKNQVDPVVKDKDVSAIVFDCNDLDFINSRVVGYLIAMCIEVGETKKLMFYRPNAYTMELIKKVGLNALMKHAINMKDVLKYIKE